MCPHEAAPSGKPNENPWAEFDSLDSGVESQAVRPLRLAFYGRCSTEDAQDPETSFQWQLRAAKSLMERVAPEATIVSTYFDIGESRSLPWKRRTQAQRMLVELDNPDRLWDGIVVGEGQRCWYGAQFSEVAPVVEHRGVTLWVPELGGEYDPKNASHYTLMTLTGGMSRGERQRVQERVRLGMAAQVETQGRYQGGRPPYGYRAIGNGPHPNPRKAAEGFQVKILVVDEPAAAVVRRIFEEYIAGASLRQIAQVLNAEGILCPSAHDPARNTHRRADGWQVSTLQNILSNGRYTGYEHWGKFKKEESLVDPNDASWGNKTRLVRSGDPIVRSRKQTHEPIVDVATFTQAQAVTRSRSAGGARGQAKLERTRRNSKQFALAGMVRCGHCGRKMEAERYNQKNDDAESPRFVRYRCRARNLVPGTEVALTHPPAVSLNQQHVLPLIGEWLHWVFADENREQVLRGLMERVSVPTIEDARAVRARERLAEAHTALKRLQDAIVAGVSISAIVEPLNQAEAEVAALTAEVGMYAKASKSVSAYDEVQALFATLGNISDEVFGHEADPVELGGFFRAVGLALVYDQDSGWLTGSITLRGQDEESPHLSLNSDGGSVRVRGGPWSLPPLKTKWLLSVPDAVSEREWRECASGSGKEPKNVGL